MVILAYKSKVCAPVVVTPMEPWMGIEAKLPINLVINQPEGINPLKNKQCEPTMRRCHRLYEYMRKQQGAQMKKATHTSYGSYLLNSKKFLNRNKPQQIIDQHSEKFL